MGAVKRFAEQVSEEMEVNRMNKKEKRSEMGFVTYPVKHWFEYHCFESESSTDAELWHHTHYYMVWDGVIERR